jgi:hypothetical protein
MESHINRGTLKPNAKVLFVINICIGGTTYKSSSNLTHNHKKKMQCNNQQK